MYFDIVARYEDIVDPDTNESLGAVERPKTRVKITWVQEKLSLASACKSREVNVGRMPLGEFSRALMPPKWLKKYETLTAEETAEPLDEKESLVKVGDAVVQVVPVPAEERV